MRPGQPGLMIVQLDAIVSNRPQILVDTKPGHNNRFAVATLTHQQVLIDILMLVTNLSVQAINDQWLTGSLASLSAMHNPIIRHGNSAPLL